jgi:hypothetical protein
MRVAAALLVALAPFAAYADSLPPNLPPLHDATVANATPTTRGTAPITVMRADAHGVRDVAQYGAVTHYTIATKTPAAFVRDYAAALQSAGWRVVVDPKQQKVATLRSSGRFSEHWLELRPAAKDVTLTLVDESFAGDTLVFGEDDSIQSMTKKFDGLFALDPPVTAASAVADEEDFPYLRHFPGFLLRNVAAHAPSLALQRVHIGGDVTDPVLTGTTITKTYDAAIATSTLRQFMAYRGALEAAGWTILDEDNGYLIDKPWLLARHSVAGGELWARLEFGGTVDQFTVVAQKK